jgi:hypothetical protein
MTHDQHTPHPSSPERNPLGLGARDPESSNTGSTADTTYNAVGSDPYPPGQAHRDRGEPPSDDGPAAPDVDAADA